MLNKISTLFQFGNNTQTNIISINPKIDVTIRRVEKDFFDGNFKQAIDDLDALIADNSNEALKSVKYQLLLLKASFLLQFRKMDQFEKLIELIEKEYRTFIEIKFKELKLTLMALHNDEFFFEFSKQIRIETPNSKPKGHFDIVFYLNIGDIAKAKEVFEEEIINTQYRNHLLLIGGHIYSNIYEYDNNEVFYFEQADTYYKEALETVELSFLDTLHIKGFYASYLLNTNFQKQIPKKDVFFDVQDYKKALDLVLKNELYFDTDYINVVIENYSYILTYLGLKDEYNEFYTKYEKKLSIKHYIQYCGVNDMEYEHNKVQEYILKNQKLGDLLVYSSLILDNSEKNIEETIKFLQINMNFVYEHSFILYSYIRGKILLNNAIEIDLIKYLEDNKYNDLDSLLAFVETANYICAEISNQDIEKLIELSLDENNLQARVLDVIKLLRKLAKRKEYLDLALSKQYVFSSIIFETLNICEKDENLYFKDFEDFVSKIENSDHYNPILGNIYVKHDKPDKAFNCFYLEAKNYENEEAMIASLKVVLDFYNKAHKVLEDAKQREIFNFLIAKKAHLSFENIIFLLMYSIHILKDTRQILSFVNQKLLNIDIQNLDNEIKIRLSSIFVQTEFGLPDYKDIFLYDANLCLVQDGKTYLKNSYTVLEENEKNFGLISIDDNEYFLKKQDDAYSMESLFHRIVGPFAFRCENPNMVQIKFNEDSDEPLSEFFAFMEDRTNHTKELFQRYSDNTFHGLFILAQHDYKNYFTLIPYLLNSEDINYNSLQINYLPSNRKKILTLSSIVFLNEINQLEVVLQRDDIVIQQTLVNWLKDYLHKFDYTNMPQDFTYLDEEGHKFIPFTEESIKQAEKFKELVLKIINGILKCKIIDDTSENLPIKEAYQHLAPHVGTQEYQALAYCINHDYQIISENNIFDMLFETMRLNKVFISNSLVLLEEPLEYTKYINLIIGLHKKKYKYILHAEYTKSLVSFMRKHDMSDLLNEEKELIKIANEYGFIEKIEQYYSHKFKVLFPKRVLPIKTHFDENVEKLFDIIEKKIQ